MHMNQNQYPLIQKKIMKNNKIKNKNIQINFKNSKLDQKIQNNFKMKYFMSKYNKKQKII